MDELTVHLEVNASSCLGYGVCVTVAEPIFELRDGLAHVLVDPVPADLAGAANEAVSECPTGAISIT
jgi:ferredoxin